LEDLTGQIFGKLTVLARGPNIGDQVGWKCQCYCGNPQLLLLRRYQLKKGIPADCGCLGNQNIKGTYGPFIDRKIALEKGLTQYFPGSACPKGHIALRWTSGGGCTVCHAERMKQKRQEGYFREYAARQRATNPNWRENKARDARVSYHRHKDDEGSREKRKAWYEKYKASSWYQESTKRAKAKFVTSGKKAEADKRYSQSEAGQAARVKARQQWQTKFEAEKGMPVTTWRIQNDPQFKLHIRLNTRIRDALMKQGIVKAAKTAELIDADIANFRSYLEANWDERMSWESYGRNGWHVDHIRPCASFDLTNEDQQRVCFNWRNLQPMWGSENISKSDNYSPEDETEWLAMMLELGFEGYLYPLYSDI